MSEFDHIDVTSTDGSTVLSDNEGIKCIYCGCLKDGVLMFYCVQCHNWVHASCLHSGPPSLILADNYYNFKCCNCTLDKKEFFQRMKVTWVQVVTLTLYNLAQTSLGKHGFFKWKEDICDFIEKYWESFFGSEKKRSQQFYCTVASILSAGNPHRFQSGYTEFGETGWWRLIDPTKAPEYIPRSLTVTVPKPRSTRKSFGFTSRTTLRKRQQANALQLAAEVKAKQACLKDPLKDNTGVACRVIKKTALASKSRLNAASVYKNGSAGSPRSVYSDANPSPDSPASFSSESRGFPTKETRVDPNLPLAAISDDESFDDFSILQNDWKDFEDCEKPRSGSEKYIRSRSKNVDDAEKITEAKPMSLYEEQKLLKKLVSLHGTDDNVQARRLRRKLLLRQRKREIGLAVFNFDATVRQLDAKEKGLRPDVEDLLEVAISSNHQSTEHRILDRFLALDVRPTQAEENSRTFHQKLVGGNESSSESIVFSPYTGRVLKPFIRRDFETKPPKLKLLEEIVSHYHRSDASWKKEASSPIDYCYVRPKHIPTINALCRQFFWPGIDLSESLQYPDFSVVALYRKMIIGFGFLVPDVAFNESYISFFLVHPDWQRSGIGTFMLYHLIQTCMGKDVTLHVSASNSAMLLYQRFGFKPEKFEADFYDKYLPTDASDCNHAFFMRLQR